MWWLWSASCSGCCTWVCCVWRVAFFWYLILVLDVCLILFCLIWCFAALVLYYLFIWSWCGLLVCWFVCLRFVLVWLIALCFYFMFYVVDAITFWLIYGGGYVCYVLFGLCWFSSVAFLFRLIATFCLLCWLVSLLLLVVWILGLSFVDCYWFGVPWAGCLLCFDYLDCLKICLIVLLVLTCWFSLVLGWLAWFLFGYLVRLFVFQFWFFLWGVICLCLTLFKLVLRVHDDCYVWVCCFGVGIWLFGLV